MNGVYTGGKVARRWRSLKDRSLLQRRGEKKIKEGMSQGRRKARKKENNR